MLAAPELAPLRVVLSVVLVVLATAVSRLLSRVLGWGPGGPLVLIAATPLVPSLPIVAGISTDDILPVVGCALCLLEVDWRRLGSTGWPRLVVVGAGLMAIAGLIASIANATDPAGATAMLLRSAGHIGLIALIGAAVSLSVPATRRRTIVAWAIVGIATFEAAFGLIAWLLPLPADAGLEAGRQMTSLLGRVPGRLAGTTGLSPNFVGAIFVLSLPITVAVALRPADRRTHLALWLAVAVQVVALALTFTRTSLVITAILLVLMLGRRHGRMLIAIAALVGVVAIATPLGARMVGDANDRAALWTSAVRMLADHPLTGVGPGRSVAVAASDPERYRFTEFGVATSSAHNTILLAGAETGVLGAIGAVLVNLSIATAALACLVDGARRVRRDWGSGPDTDLVVAAALGTLGFLAQGMTNNLFAVRVTSVLWILVVAAFLVPVPWDLAAAIRSRLARPPGPRGNPASTSG